jgi:hypothetical protein
VEGASSLLTATVTDSLGNTWVDDKNFTSVTSGGGSRVGCVHAIVTTGGACTVTVKPSGTGFVSFGLVEVSGLDTASLVGGNNGARGTSTAPDSGSVTPVSGGDGRTPSPRRAPTMLVLTLWLPSDHTKDTS